MSHIEAVRDIYSAFSRQDVPAILERLAPDVDWEYAYRDEGVPWLLPRRGREQVLGFFQSLAGLELRKFELKRLLGDGDLVLALFEVEGVARQTGRGYVEQDEVHLWYFNERGQVQRFRHVVDTLQHWRALQP
jgi:ketosteroid isomerase-like protein